MQIRKKQHKKRSPMTAFEDGVVGMPASVFYSLELGRENRAECV
jgi:hypothetical protein